MAKKSYCERFTEAFWNELRAMREGAQLSQAEMGRRLGRSQRSISHIEFGTTRLDFPQVMNWCLVCGVDFVEFARRMQIAQQSMARADVPANPAARQTR